MSLGLVQVQDRPNLALKPKNFLASESTRLSHSNLLRDALRFSKQPVIVDQFKMQSHPLNAGRIVGGVGISLIAKF